MSGSLFFLSVLGYALAVMLLVPKLRAGSALLCAVCGMLFVSFYGVIMAEWMVPTACAVICGGWLCLLIGAVCAVKNLRSLRSRLVSPGLWFFLAAAALTVVCCRDLLIQDHDSLSYWARAAKELYTFDRFYIHENTTMFHTDYIPLMAALQYSAVRVLGWQDLTVACIPAACVAASIAAGADLLPCRRVFAALGSVLLYYAYAAFGFNLIGLRADGPMLAVFTAALLTVLVRREDEPAAFIPGLCACAVLTGFKIYSGLMYAAVIAAAMLFECMSLRRKKLPWRAAGVMTLLSVLLIAALQLGWSVRYNAAEAAGSAVSAAELLGGNPRTAQLLQSFTPEKIAQFLTLAGQTFAMYASSELIWLWPFVIAAIVLACFGERRSAALKTFVYLAIAAVVYLGGLFASYFVQAETAGAATNYLSTASAPLLMASVFFALYLVRGRLRVPAFAVLAAMVVGLTALTSPAVLIPRGEDDVYVRYAALANDFYENEIAGQLTEADAEKKALLIECSYGATEVKSPSGKTHAYAYFALPVRVTEPVYYTHGDYTLLEEGIDGEALMQLMEDRGCELLILRIEDELYWDEISYALDLYGDWDGPVGVYDIIREDDTLTFAFRGGEEESE